MVLTIATYGIINLVLSRYAARTGLTVSVFSRTLFGLLGSALASLIFAATAIYYAVFEGSIIAVAFHEYFGGNLVFWYAAVVVFAIPWLSAVSSTGWTGSTASCCRSTSPVSLRWSSPRRPSRAYPPTGSARPRPVPRCRAG
ncbi:hypothetical protein [Arthrobacter sp. UYCu712]|uniref:hypothetical protein n=1 Tax=Arthrobacter sp. UYCu712 TaxID=3156340 RepID=UPI003395A529